MPRQESDREDLLREATALVERAELRIPGEREPITVGFRRDGSLSIFFGGDPVYQFNAAGEVRRAYADGLLVKAEKGRLVALRRERTQTEVALLRRELSDAETAEWLADSLARLTKLHGSLSAGSFHTTGQVPADRDIMSRVREWFQAHGASLAIADRPNAG